MVMIKKMYIKLAAFAVVLIFTLAVFFSNTVVQAQITIPETIKVGLSFGSTANNNFTLKSATGLKLEVIENGSYQNILSFIDNNGIKIRKDVYYNIVDGIAKEINYTKAVAYKGEVTGPYHIQVGEAYPSIQEAQQLAEIVSSVSPNVFLAYESGWKVWTQLYTDENECLQQIEILKNEIADYSFSVVHPNMKRVQILEPISDKLMYILNAQQPIKLTPLAKENTVGAIEYGTSKYRGSILISRLDNSDINVVNELLFEEYLYGVVPREMPASWHIEAVKAQAVASRCYAIRNIGKHASQGFDLCNQQHCQVYLGYGGEHPNSNKAVNETKGRVIVYDGKIIPTYFSAASGGHTENSENYWSAVLPYIRGVDDSYEKSPYANWDMLFKKSEIKAKLSENGVDIGDIIDIIPLQISEFGRVIKLQIKGTKNSIIYEKERIRIVFGYSNLKSTWFNVLTDADVYITSNQSNSPTVTRASSLNVLSADGIAQLNGLSEKIVVKGGGTETTYNVIPEMYTFRGKGYGHGLGMSQYGAKGMAEAGFNYIQILEHYFTGAKVQ